MVIKDAFYAVVRNIDSYTNAAGNTELYMERVGDPYTSMALAEAAIMTMSNGDYGTFPISRIKNYDSDAIPASTTKDIDTTGYRTAAATTGATAEQPTQNGIFVVTNTGSYAIASANLFLSVANIAAIKAQLNDLQIGNFDVTASGTDITITCDNDNVVSVGASAGTWSAFTITYSWLVSAMTVDGTYQALPATYASMSAMVTAFNGFVTGTPFSNPSGNTLRLDGTQTEAIDILFGALA